MKERKKRGEGKMEERERREEGGWVGKYEGRREDGRREDEEWWRGGGEGERRAGERRGSITGNLSQGRGLTYHSQSD